MVEHGIAEAVHDHCPGNPAGGVNAVQQLLVLVPPHGEGKTALLPESLNLLRCVLRFLAQGNEGDLILHFLINLVQHRELIFAGVTPCRPEVDQYRLVVLQRLAQGKGFPFAVRHRKIRERFPQKIL